MKIISIFIALTLSLFAEMDYAGDIDSKEALDMQKKGAIVIDVRTPIEFFYVGHGKGHINIPFFDMLATPKSIERRVRFSEMELKSDKNFNKSKSLFDINYIENKNFIKNVKKLVGTNVEQPILFICRTGPRSQEAANIIANEGYEEVYNVSDGFRDGWSKFNLPVAQEK